MKIFIEGNALFSTRPSGVGQYTKRLLEAMADIAPQNQYTVFGFHFFAKATKPLKIVQRPSVGYRFVRWMPGRAYSVLFKKGIKLPIDVLLGQNPDIVFYPNFIRWPLLGSAKSVVVVHDIAFAYFPQYIEPKNLRYLQKNLPY